MEESTGRAQGPRKRLKLKAMIDVLKTKQPEPEQTSAEPKQGTPQATPVIRESKRKASLPSKIDFSAREAEKLKTFKRRKPILPRPSVKGASAPSKVSPQSLEVPGLQAVLTAPSLESNDLDCSPDLEERKELTEFEIQPVEKDGQPQHTMDLSNFAHFDPASFVAETYDVTKGPPHDGDINSAEIDMLLTTDHIRLIFPKSYQDSETFKRNLYSISKTSHPGLQRASNTKVGGIAEWRHKYYIFQPSAMGKTRRRKNKKGELATSRATGEVKVYQTQCGSMRSHFTKCLVADYVFHWKVDYRHETMAQQVIHPNVQRIMNVDTPVKFTKPRKKWTRKEAKEPCIKTSSPGATSMELSTVAKHPEMKGWLKPEMQIRKENLAPQEACQESAVTGGRIPAKHAKTIENRISKLEKDVSKLTKENNRIKGILKRAVSYLAEGED